jgi:hypothetical protein
MELSHTHPWQGGLMMSFSNHGRFYQQVRFLRRQFLQNGELPFTDLLSEGMVTQALNALNVVWLDRIYSRLVTLWVFLGYRNMRREDKTPSNCEKQKLLVAQTDRGAAQLMQTVGCSA